MIPGVTTAEEAKAVCLGLSVVWMRGNDQIGYGVTSDQSMVVQLCSCRARAHMEATIMQEQRREAGYPVPIVMEYNNP